MPYIDKNRREELEQADLDRVIKKLTVRNLSAGDLNYIITKLLDAQMPTISYTKSNELIGVLECVKLEFYRKLVAPYEDKKEVENGKVYAERTSTSVEPVATPAADKMNKVEVGDVVHYENLKDGEVGAFSTKPIESSLIGLKVGDNICSSPHIIITKIIKGK
jgi:hypothetical protein